MTMQAMRMDASALQAECSANTRSYFAYYAARFFSALRFYFYFYFFCFFARPSERKLVF